MELWISILVVITLLLAANIVQIILKGDKGKKGELTNVFNKLEAIETLKEEKKKAKRMTSKQYILLFIPISLIAFVFSLVFFRSFMSAVLVTFISALYPRYIIVSRERKLKSLLNYQLRDALNALSSSLKAGSSLTNALIRTYQDLNRIYLNTKNKPIVDEFLIITYELELMIPVEEVLINFKERNKLEDITDFVNVTLMTKEKGGNLNEVIQRVAEIITDRIEIEQEINTLVAGKKMEAKVLTILPILLVVLLSLMSPEYMAPMYDSSLGRVLMIISTIMLVVNYFIGKKIINIDV